MRQTPAIIPFWLVISHGDPVRPANDWSPAEEADGLGLIGTGGARLAARRTARIRRLQMPHHALQVINQQCRILTRERGTAGGKKLRGPHMNHQRFRTIQVALAHDRKRIQETGHDNLKIVIAIGACEIEDHCGALGQFGRAVGRYCGCVGAKLLIKGAHFVDNEWQ